jgi:ABC-type sugar transport system substrate-binding protein
VALLFLAIPAQAHDEGAKTGKPINFVLLRPDTDHPFWELFEHVMRSTCADLGCTVEVKFANWDRFKMIEQAADLAQGPEKPDVVFFQSFKGNGPDIIKLLDHAEIDSFLINAGLTPEQSIEIGKPREIYKHWIGQMMPDDFGAGVMTAQALYDAARKKGYMTDGKIYVAGIEGNSADGASIERLKGLHAFAEQHNDMELLQVVQGKWDTGISKKMATALMRRYPDIHVIWAAGDPIAFGVLDAATETGLPPQTILTSGVDWAPRALDEIENGTMVGSAGGHFMEGAWATICAYDYLMGIDFADAFGVEIKSKMGFLTKENLPYYREKFGKGNFDSVDFKRFSRYYGAQVGSYDFDISELFKKE